MPHAPCNIQHPTSDIDFDNSTNKQLLPIIAPIFSPPMILLGYFVAIGTAVIGTTVGIVTSEIYQQFADYEQEHMQEEVEMLTALQVNILQSRSHEQKLIYLITEPAKFRQEHIHLKQHLAIVNQKWRELQLSLSQDHRDNEMHTHAYPHFLQTYQDVIEQYTQSLETLLQQIETSHQTPAAIIQHRNLSVHFTNSNAAIKFEQLSDELEVLINDSHQEYIDANSVEIRIIDNCGGINPDNIQKLFDPFFTTKAVGKGTGLGLSIGYQIITEQHGGKLTCKSVPGVGAEFIIQIPIQQILTS